MQFFKKTNIDFIGKRKIFYAVSIIITVVGLIVAFARGVEYGIDFEGGAEIAYKFSAKTEAKQVRDAIDAGGFKGAEVKSFGENQYLIRVKGSEIKSGGEKPSLTLLTLLEKAMPGNKATLLKSDTIGPKIGGELRLEALKAVLVSILFIMLYIWFRFEFLFGVGAIVALAHDVLVAFAFAVICNGLFGLNLEMNQGMLAAFLTVVGFSVNDTVIIFDRIRETKDHHKGENLIQTMNRAINETLPRTINTSLTVALVLVILLFFSGEVLQGFAFTMLIGIITGTYSSVYIASALVITILIKQGKLNDPDAIIKGKSPSLVSAK